MSNNDTEKKPVKKVGRPKNNPIQDEEVNEVNQERLDMADQSSGIITIDDMTKRWNATFAKMVQNDGSQGISTIAAQWNKLNPFLQNERLKQIYTNAKKYNKANISEFLSSPGSHEQELRSLGWANSGSQQIYYNILRRSADIPLYNYFLIPDVLENYKDKKFDTEDRFLNEWIDLFNIKNTFKTIALEVKREGKSSYLFRNKIVGEGQNRQPAFTTLQKLPTEWTKITGKGQLGYTVSFNMMYFLNIANSPSDFGDFMEDAWNNMVESGVITEKLTQENSGKYFEFNPDKAVGYKFAQTVKVGGKETVVEYSSSLEYNSKKKSYLFWLRLPYDICYTFGSDNSHPWVAPDTMGLMLKLQELSDYGQLAGLIASTPLTAVLTGEIETIANPRAGKNESVYSPEVLQGYMTQFNQATSTNIEAWLWPAKNIKLQQLATDVNSSEIISTATTNFLTSGGEGGLVIATEKPNIGQIVVAKQLAASQQNYVTLQFENVMNFIIQHKLGLINKWKIKIWGDVFNIDSDKGFLKEVVAGGNIALLPKLMSAEGISLRDTKAITEYIKTLGFYKDFMTYTQLQQEKAKKEQTEGSVGRPSVSDDKVENDATGASKNAGTNRADNRQ